MGGQNLGITPIPYHPEAAKALLASAGWLDTDGDGILDKDGVPFSFQLITNSENPRRAKAAVVIQATLKEVGIEVEIQKWEANTFFSILRKKDFDAAISGFGDMGTTPEPRPIWHSTEQSWNNSTYRNPQVDALIEQWELELDPDAGDELLRSAFGMIYAEQPYTFLYWRKPTIPVDERFQNVSFGLRNRLDTIHLWYVEAEDVKY